MNKKRIPGTLALFAACQILPAAGFPVTYVREIDWGTFPRMLAAVTESMPVIEKKEEPEPEPVKVWVAAEPATVTYIQDAGWQWVSESLVIDDHDEIAELTERLNGLWSRLDQVTPIQKTDNSERIAQLKQEISDLQEKIEYLKSQQTIEENTTVTTLAAPMPVEEEPVSEPAPEIQAEEEPVDVPVDETVEEPVVPVVPEVPEEPEPEVPAVDYTSQIQEAETELAGKQAELDALEAEAPEAEVPEESAETNGDMPGTTPNRHLLLKELDDLTARIDSLGTEADADELESLRSRLSEVQSLISALKTVSVYRVYNPNSGEHFYTSSEDEVKHLVSVGWRNENVGWKSPVYDESHPVYRVYNPNAGDHHYTTSLVERNHLVSMGWRAEGISWYDDAWAGVQVLRVYNPNATAGAHHFTTSEIERDMLVSMGWRDEQIGFHSRFTYSICKVEADGATHTVWYDENDQRLTGSQQVNGYWYYYYPETGYQAQGMLQVPDGDGVRYFRSDGRHARGRVTIGNDLYCFDDGSGYRVENRFVTSGNTITFYGSDGKALRSGFTRNNIEFTPDSSGNIVKAVINGLIFYMQTDPSWAGAYVNGYTFVATGCVPSVLASIVNRLTGYSVTPLSLGRLLAAHGYMNSYNLGAGGSGVIFVASSYGMHCEALGSVDAAARILRTGGLIALAVNPGYFVSGGTHELLVYGYDNGYVWVHDPYYSGNDGKYTLSFLFSQLSSDGYDRESGGPVFGFYNSYV